MNKIELQRSVHYAIDKNSNRILILPFIRKGEFNRTPECAVGTKLYFLAYDLINPDIHEDNFTHFQSGTTIYYEPITL